MARNVSTGVFAGLGGSIVVTTYVEPDPAIIEAELMQVASNLEDTMKPMLAAREVAREDIQAHFDSESSPDGFTWAALDGTYLKYKESLGYPSDILHRTGAMEEAATSREAFVVTPTGLFFNWNALPRDKNGNIIGQIHQAGSESAGMRVADFREGHEGEELRFTGGYGRGNALPQRPFVGMSDIADAQFVEVFDVWFDESIQAVVHPKTGVMQARTAGGQFGKRLN